MSLYQEIILLQTHFDGKYCVENVIPYYEPLIKGKKIGRHIYWTNFKIPYDLKERDMSGVMCGQSNNELQKLCEFHKIDLSSYKGKQRKDKIARNLVDYEAGKTILETALGVIKSKNQLQQSLIF